MAIKTTEQLRADIAAVRQAERVTKEKLSSLSRDLLNKWNNDHDPELINELLGHDDAGKYTLTPLNWRIACMYFFTFVGAASNYTKDVEPYVTKGKGNRTPLVFGLVGKNQQKRTAAKREAWLANEDNNIWTWSAENVTMQDKNIDYAKQITKAVTDAVSEDKGNLSLIQVLDAVLAVEGVSMADIMNTVNDIMKQPEQQAA